MFRTIAQSFVMTCIALVSMSGIVAAEGSWGSRTFKLAAGITSGYGRYVKSLGEP